MHRLITTLAASALLGSALAGTALAHAKFVSSTPAPGSTVTSSPSSVTIAFTEELAAGSTGFVSNAGRETVSAGATISTTDRHVLTISLKPGLPSGGYTVFWHSISADDGDTLDGSFSFTVAQGAVAQAAPAAAPVGRLPSTSTDGAGRAGPAFALVGLAAVLALVSVRALRGKARA